MGMELRREPNATLDAQTVEFESSKVQERNLGGRPALQVVFLVGVGGVLVTLRYPYPLLGAEVTTLVILVGCLCAGLLLFSAPRDMAIMAKDVIVALVPAVLAGVLLFNGYFDGSAETLHRTAVVRVQYGRRGRTLVVQSWRPGRTTESISLRSGWYGSRPTYTSGQSVTIGTRDGALGMVWVTRVVR